MQNPRTGIISSQLIEIIEWTDTTNDTIIYKFPVHNNQIKNNAQLIVRESQVAIFLNEGQMGDVFYPGRHLLTTKNIPVLSSLKGWKYGFESPFKADVYFVNTKQFAGFRWGTANPILMRDQELGVVRLRAFGNFAFRVTDAPKFFWEIAGTNLHVTTEGAQTKLRSLVVSIFSDTLANARIPVLDLSTKYLELSRLTMDYARQSFGDVGLMLSGFTVENISLTEDVEKHVDKRSSMNVVGDLDKYTKFQMADSIPDAMVNPGGMASMGAGFALGAEIAKALGGSLVSSTSTITPVVVTPKLSGTASPTSSAIICANCNANLPTGAAFCSNCGQKITPSFCMKCGEAVTVGAKFCLKCGGQL